MCIGGSPSTSVLLSTLSSWHSLALSQPVALTLCYVPVYPSVPVYLQRNLTEYFVAVDINNMLQLYASMLHERRIIITSSKLSTVSPLLIHSLSCSQLSTLPCQTQGEQEVRKHFKYCNRLKDEFPKHLMKVVVKLFVF